MATKVNDFYKQKEYYNSVCKATIMGAWVVDTDMGVIPVASEFSDEETTRKSAKKMGFDLSFIN